MKTRSFLLAPLFLSAVLLGGVSAAEENAKYRGTGEALVIGDDLPKAKREALSEAFRSAIQKAVGVYVKAQSKVENFELTYNRIMSESEGYVTDYRILREKTENGVYSVEIEAEVSGDKLADAFSQRLSKYIEKNLFSSFTISAYAVNSGNRFYSLMINCTISVNDPTIDTGSITVKLPVTGWIRPAFNRSGLSTLISVSENIEVKTLASSKYLDDVLYFLDKKGAVARISFKNPGTGKQEERALQLERLTASVSWGIGWGVNIQNREFADIGDQERAEAAAALRKTGILLEKEKKLIGMNGNFVLTIISVTGGTGNFCSLYLSFSIPATSVDLGGIEASSIQIKFPKAGWIKPEIRETEYSIDVSLNFTGTDPPKFKYLADVAYLFGKDAFELELKYRNRKSGAMEIRMASVSFITVSATEDGRKVLDVQARSFDKLEAGQKSSIRKYLTGLSR
ncbi:MAG: flagellar assembly protein T N-terminal domain-containing protein [Spirochaetes bacterium]|nr:flagellar assembly protein T N-terminal domain-containing protein [Spirochaetota bacterium]